MYLRTACIARKFVILTSDENKNMICSKIYSKHTIPFLSLSFLSPLRSPPVPTDDDVKTGIFYRGHRSSGYGNSLVTKNSAMEIRFLWRKQFKFRKTLVPLVGSGKQTRISLKRLSCVTFSDIYNGCCLCCYMVPHCNSDRPPGIHSDTVTITNFYH